MNLIDKDALVAEIDKLVDKGKYQKEFARAYRDGNNNALYALKEIINTLEVKEVQEEPVELKEMGLKKEIQTFSMELAMKENNGDWEKDIRTTAEYFFKLGLKAQKGE